MKRKVVIAILGAAVVGSAALSRVPSAQVLPLTNEAYVWQRVWTPRVSLSVAGNTQILTGMRVLAAELGADRQLVRPAPDFAAMARAGKPVVAVIRVDGRLDDAPPDLVADIVSGVISDWTGQGAAPSGIEIDFDCPVSNLPGYANLLARVRSAAGSARLSITALPSWMASERLADVLDQVDEVVLQVHAVRDPRRGLFDPSAASDWVRRFAAYGKPFRIALPTYGARVTTNEEGAIAAVESEVSGLIGEGSSFEITADPDVLAEFGAKLRASRPQELLGIVWFRLPVDGDRRAWSGATWRSVVSGSRVPSRIAVRSEAQPNGARRILLENRGEGDATVPRQVSWSGRCPSDGANGYELVESDGGAVLRRTQQSIIRAAERRVIGWTRCPVEEEDLHVQN